MPPRSCHGRRAPPGGAWTTATVPRRTRGTKRATRARTTRPEPKERTAASAGPQARAQLVGELPVDVGLQRDQPPDRDHGGHGHDLEQARGVAPPGRRRCGERRRRRRGRSAADGAVGGGLHDLGVLAEDAAGVLRRVAASSRPGGRRAPRRRRRRRAARWPRRGGSGRRRAGTRSVRASTASGAMCPTHRPVVPPEKRPSVTSRTSLPRPGALDGAGDREHLAHPRAALGALVADDDDVAGWIPPSLERVHRGPLAVEDPRRALEHLVVEAGRLHHRALRRQRPVQDRDAAGAVDRLGSERMMSSSTPGGSSASRFSAIVRR